MSELTKNLNIREHLIRLLRHITEISLHGRMEIPLPVPSLRPLRWLSQKLLQVTSNSTLLMIP